MTRIKVNNLEFKNAPDRMNCELIFKRSRNLTIYAWFIWATNSFQSIHINYWHIYICMMKFSSVFFCAVTKIGSLLRIKWIYNTIWINIDCDVFVICWCIFLSHITAVYTYRSFNIYFYFHFFFHVNFVIVCRQ